MPFPTETSSHISSFPKSLLIKVQHCTASPKAFAQVSTKDAPVFTYVRASKMHILQKMYTRYSKNKEGGQNFFKRKIVETCFAPYYWFMAMTSRYRCSSQK